MEMESLHEYQDILDGLLEKINDTSILHIFKKMKLEKQFMDMMDQLGSIYVNSLEYHNLKQRYDEIIYHVSHLFQKMEFTDPIQIFAVYSYMIRNGYFSLNHHFTYDVKVEDCLYLLGCNVMDGRGVCRHITTFLTDLYREMGFVSLNIGMTHESTFCLTKQDYDCVDYCKDSYSVIGDILKKFVTFMISEHFFNHLITLIKDQNGTLLLDPTNDVVFYVKEHRVITPILDKDMSMSCGYLPEFNSEFHCQFRDYLSITNPNVLVDLEECYDKAWKQAESSTYLFDNFYHDNYSLYQDTVHKKDILLKEYKRYIKR